MSGMFNSAYCTHSVDFSGVMTDEAMRRLAYSKESYKNVGALHKITKLLCSSIRQKIGSVTYIGGKTCLTNAHCVKINSWDLDDYFIIGYQVSFELTKGVHTFFDVKEHVIHPDYFISEYSDIAVICLNKKVDGLDGLTPTYLFGKNSRYCVDQLNNELTGVGYGHSGDDNDLFITNDMYRRAIQTKILYIQKTYFINEISYKLINGLIPSLPYKKDLKLSDKEPSNFLERCDRVSRDRLPNETLVRQGMSGGAMFFNDKLVGINTLTVYVYSSGYDYAKQYILQYSNRCFNLMFGLFCRIREFFPFDGSLTLGVPLGAYEDWIEEHRTRFDRSCSELIDPHDRGLDLEEGGGSLGVNVKDLKHKKNV